jgi:hypothetical protein
LTIEDASLGLLDHTLHEGRGVLDRCRQPLRGRI